MIRALVLLATCALPAQSLTVTNPTPHPWSGWVRVARPAAFYMGWAQDQSAMFVQSGNHMDLKVSVAAGSSTTLSPSTWPAWTRPVSQLTDLAALYNGLPTLNGKPMEMQKLAIDGAGLRMSWSYTWDLVWHCETSVVWYPDQPWLVVGTSSVECFEPSGQLFYTIMDNLTISWGDGNNSGPIVTEKTQMANGQRVVKRAVFSWHHLASSVQQASILSAMAGVLTVN